MRIKISLFIAIFAFTGCSKIRKLTDEVTKPSAREIYQRNFKPSDPRFQLWKQSFANAISDSLQVIVPYGEKGLLIPESYDVYSYTFTMKEGENLLVSVQKDSLEQQVFIDIFNVSESSKKHLISNDRGDYQIEYPINSSGQYKVIVQPEILAKTNLTILIDKKPRYRFPVAGKDNSAIQSFWGYERDGGKRSHEGIDIFAPRGTPVVAVANGVVNSTGDRGLGGKQVWLRVDNNSLYYAHLDSINTSMGARVEVGDTLGFVGSTGNAEGGSPHLHFGIYGGSAGAVNPLPFVYTYPRLKAESLMTEFLSKKLYVSTSTANLRIAPDAKSDLIGILTRGDAVHLLGEFREWAHIRTASGVKAFLHKSLVTSNKKT